jgi:predicted Zn-dependent protease
MTRVQRVLIAALVAFPLSALAQSQSGCGSLTNAYGPFDYRSNKKELKVIEDYHFTPDVEQLKRGSTGAIGGDLDYTLRAFPNHHRALMSMANLALKTNTRRVAGAQYPVDCYFDRALRFANDDGIVRIVLGIYLYRIDKKANARQVLEDARRFEDSNPNLHYNLAFVYLDLGDKTNALASAKKAYSLGAPLPGLRKKLQAMGIWKDSPGDADTTDAEPPRASSTPPVAN